MKIELLRNLMLGYQSLDSFYNDVLELTSRTKSTLNFLTAELSKDSFNVHILKFISLINMAVFSDLIESRDNEKKIQELVLRDKCADKDTINSLSLINGDVVNLITIFKENRCKLLTYSQRAPAFFGYSLQEFRL